MSGFAVREGDASSLVLSNIPAERKVLGQILHDNSWADLIADQISDRDFAEPVNGRIFAVAMSEIAQRRRASPVLITPLLKDDEDFTDLGGQTFLTALVADVQFEVADKAYAEHIRALATQRRLISTMRRAIEEASTPGANLEHIVAQADAGLTAAIERQEVSAFRDAADCIDEVISGFDRKIYGVTSGVVQGIDELIGQIRPGWLGIIAGRPGMGKTAAIVSYLRGAAAKGHHVLLASLEMTWETLSLRLVSDHCYAIGEPVAFKSLMDGNVQPHHRRSIVDARDDIAALPLEVIDKRCHTLSQLRRSIRRHKRKLEIKGKKLELVAVDYLQLLHPDREMKSEFDAVTEVSRTLKEMAGEEDVAIIALSQLSRAVEQRTDHRPQLSDLRSSGQIEQDADFVIFLLSEEYYLTKQEPAPNAAEHDAWQAKMDRARGLLEFICAKYRHGPEGIFHGRFFRPYQAVR